MTPQRRKRRIPGPVEDLIRELQLGGWTAAQIYEEVTKQRPGEDEVSLRTIQRIVAELPIAGPKTPPTDIWTVRDADPNEARHVLPVLGKLLLWSKFRRTSITKDEARWIAHISKVAPSFLTIEIYSTAMMYLRNEQASRSAKALDIYVAAQLLYIEDHPESSLAERSNAFTALLLALSSDLKHLDLDLLRELEWNFSRIDELIPSGGSEEEPEPATGEEATPESTDDRVERLTKSLIFAELKAHDSKQSQPVVPRKRSQRKASK